MNKRVVVSKNLSFALKILLCVVALLGQSMSAQVKKRKCIITEQAKKAVIELYDLFKYKRGNRQSNLPFEEIVSKVQDSNDKFYKTMISKIQSLDDRFYQEFSQGCDSKSIKNAVGWLKEGFFGAVAEDARAPYWLWKSSFQSSAWWKALNGSIKEFLVYLYRINSPFYRSKSGITETESVDNIQYIFNGKILKTVPKVASRPSWLNRQWNKLIWRRV